MDEDLFLLDGEKPANGADGRSLAFTDDPLFDDPTFGS